jgi:hypothetical protein
MKTVEDLHKEREMFGYCPSRARKIKLATPVPQPTAPARNVPPTSEALVPKRSPYFAPNTPQHEASQLSAAFKKQLSLLRG